MLAAARFELPSGMVTATTSSVSFPDCGEPIPTGEPVLDQWVRFHSTTSEYIAVIVYRISYKTSQELQMLPRSLSVCQSTIKNASKGLTIVSTSV